MPDSVVNKSSSFGFGIKAYNGVLAELNRHFSRTCAETVTTGSVLTSAQKRIVHQEFDRWCASQSLSPNLSSELWQALQGHICKNPYLQTTLMRSLFLEIPPGMQSKDGSWRSPRQKL